MFKIPPLSENESEDITRLADWVELNLLTEEEPIASVTSIADELAEIPPDDSDESEQRNLQDDPSDRDDGEIRNGYWENADKKAEAAFGELNSRLKCLEGRYPLNVYSGVASVDPSTGALEFYKFLVLLRARQMYPMALGDDGQESGLMFEEISKFALGAYLGSGPDYSVRFGVAGGQRGDGLPADGQDAVEELSKRMKEHLGAVPDRGDVDYGADAIAWRPFADSLPGQLIIVGQAKIGESDWKKGQPPKRWVDRGPEADLLIRFVARPLSAVLFPETLSLTKLEELTGANFTSVPFDRLRLLGVLRDEDLPYDLLDRMRNWGHEFAKRLP